MLHLALLAAAIASGGAGCQLSERKKPAPAAGATTRATPHPAPRRGRTVWESRGPGGGGALFGPSISPHDAGELFLATDMSGVFHTRNSGRTWATLPFFEIQGDTATQVRFTADPRVLFSLSAASGPLSLVRSVDAGATWRPPSADPLPAPLYQLFVDPAEARRVIVSAVRALHASLDGGAHFHECYRSASSGPGLLAAGAHFHGGDVLVATSDGLLASHDGGAHFALEPAPGIPGGEAIASFAGATAAGRTRLFAVTFRAEAALPGMTGGDLDAFVALYVKDDGGPWRRAVNGVGRSDKLSIVATSGSEPDVAFAAGGDRATSAPVVYRTGDGGASWRSVLLTRGNANVRTGWSGDGGSKSWGFGEYALGLAVRPGDSSRVALTDLGFVHVSSDGGRSWRQAYVDPSCDNPAGRRTPLAASCRSSGVENTSVWWLTFASPSILFASLTDITSARSDDGGESWARPGDSGLTLNTTYQAIAGKGGELYAATSSVHDLFQSPWLTDDQVDGRTGRPGRGAIMISRDGGARFQLLEDLRHPVVFLALAPDGSALYASVVHSSEGGIFRKELAGNRPATRLPAPPRTEGHPYNLRALSDGSVLASCSARREGTYRQRGRFTPSAGVFLLPRGATTWLDRSAPEMQRWTRDVVVDPGDPSESTWLAGVFSAGGDGVGGLYRTTDRGRTWRRITPPMNVESCAFSPRDPAMAYLATETQGLWVTHDARAEQPRWSRVDEYPFSHPIRVFWNPFDPGEAWAASFGGGLRVNHE